MGDPNIIKGLAGVYADSTAIAKVIPEINSLVYRGYPVQDLAENCLFEEVAYLMWNGELPKHGQLEEFCQAERRLRPLSEKNLKLIKMFDTDAHPMDTLRTVVGFMGTEDPRVFAIDRESNMDKAMNLLAKIPTAIAATYRCRKGLDVIPPRDDLPMSENFFHMCFGEIPDKETIKAFDVSLTLYAEHSFNASTFAARVITSTLSDMHSSVVGGIGALKGPLHGGANEQVMHMLKEVKSPEKAEQWMLDALAQKKKVMGFGHRVYRNGDSRVPTMTKYAEKMADKKGDKKWMPISKILRDVMVDKKNIYPNLDFPAGPAYYLMGFEIDMFTPIFVMSRITGWTAHIMEQLEENKIIRPLSAYHGHGERKVGPIDKR